MTDTAKRKSVSRVTATNRRTLLRYGTMVFGILAFVPPVGFIAQIFGGVMLCGNLCSRMAIGLNLPSELVSRTAGVVLLFLWLTVTLFFGRWMCSHVCPVGALTEFGSKLLPARLRIDYCKHLDAPLFRYGFLASYILLPAIGLASICCAYCNWSTIPETFAAIFIPSFRAALTTGAKLVSVALYVGLLGMLARDGRGHCHLVCPVGAVDLLVNYFGAKLPFAWRMRVNAEDCSGCGQCVKSCPASAIRLEPLAAEGSDPPHRVATIDYHRCYQCRACEGACARGTLSILRAGKEQVQPAVEL